MKNKFTPVVFLILPLAVCFGQDLKINWIEVQGGQFTMGSESSVREVFLESFYISQTEIIFDQFEAYCKSTGIESPDDNGWQKGNRPVIHVSWNDATAFCKWLSEKSGSTVRLPTEAEWEYAAIGGNKSKGFFYSGSDNWREVSWSEENSENKTQPVAGKKPNELNLYDMSGNVWEWCSDLPGGTFNPEQRHPLKGNSFDNPASDPRLPAVRIEADARHYNIGFRIVKTK